MVGQNQSFKKVFVTNTAALASTGSTDALTLGQLGIFNAQTYEAVTDPEFPDEPGIIIAQGTPDLSGYPVGAGIRNESDKSKVIVGRKITHWSGKAANTGQNGIVAVGYDGTDTSKTMTGLCDETKHLYIRLTGKPVQVLHPGGVTLHYAVTGPCCDACGDNCAEVEGAFFRDAFYDLMAEDKLVGGMPLSQFINVTKLNGTNGDDEGVYGLQFESSFVDIITDTCYYDIFPYNADPVHVEISSYDPDWHGEQCFNEYPVTVIQEVEYPVGRGDYVIRFEEKSKMWDHRYYARDLALRRAEGVQLIADPTEQYDEYTLRWDHSYKVGGFSETYTDSYELHIFYPTGDGTAFETAINDYIDSTGIGLPPVNL